MAEEEKPMERSTGTTPARKRRGFSKLTVIIVLLVGGLALTPTLLLKTPLRNRLVTSVIGNTALTATAESASGGWFSPISFKSVRISNNDERFLVTIDELKTSRGLLAGLSGGTDKGLIQLQHPHVELVADDAGHWPELGSKRESDSVFDFQITNGELVLSLPTRELPIVDIDRLQVRGSVQSDEGGQRTLTIERTVLADHEPLSEAHTRQNLALIAPVLSQSASLQGAASVVLEEIRISLDAVDREQSVPIRGVVTFHELEAELRDDWVRQLTMLTGELSGRQVPTRVTVLKESTVSFAVTRDGVEHDGMTFLLPQVADGLSLESSGLIRNDETLDLDLVVTMPQVLPANRPFLTLLSQVSNEPLRLTVTGTVNEPKIGLPEASSILTELTKRIAPASLEQPADSLPNALNDLLQSAAQPDKAAAREAIPGGVLNLIRSIDEARKKKSAEDPDASSRPKRRRRGEKE